MNNHNGEHILEFIKSIDKYVISKYELKDIKSLVWKWSKWLAPSFHQKIKDDIENQVNQVITESFPPIEGLPLQLELPNEGLSDDEILRRLGLLQKSDVDTKQGKLFAYVYPTLERQEKIIVEAQNMFVHLNALNPTAFQSLRRMEVEVVQMIINLLNGGESARGTMTSGGTESLLMAIKTYRDRAFDLYNITEPEVVLPITAHPALEKAGRYFQVKLRYVPLVGDCQVDMRAFEKTINRNTILLVGSAPQYPHGLMDPIQEMGRLALKYKLPLHVDSCFGGLFLPFMEKLGFEVPPFDFRVPGVTSISADIHKFGYCTKGSSVLSFINDSYRMYQFMPYVGWPGGLFVSPSMLGTRGGGPIAAAWTSLVAHGENNYKEITARIMVTARAIREGINSIDGLRVIGNPVMCALAFVSENPEVNVHCIADLMQSNTKLGWKLERTHKPNAVHLTLMQSHVGKQDELIADLRQCYETVAKDPKQYINKGSAAMYSGIANIPLDNIADDFLKCFLAKTYSAPSRTAEQQPNFAKQN
ncbi:sphingosine-1-phosphate lyase [Heterostelium album PN500]|uniref:sphinganine-1-phosphate aldolase n=1 Tax=Heterostelium pallidum (strain ATCC 26659 / Pp 5 / PN500) TaxID=670386 RepID=D3BMM3_HETP5|nr:sphingosine-1-phosphate lyase [Heterostelium album PN500]EFA77235.1 sphingosine-1-phosphate lyase [Heterostelium album PN500]|eukprot:XP_020429364.1 sphingosine-1-phosphate lyase [Heterostelium album PN500]